VKAIYANVPVLDNGCPRFDRSPSSRVGVGDVLLAWEENEAFSRQRAWPKDKFEIVDAEPFDPRRAPVTVVDKVVDKKGYASGGEILSKLHLLASLGQDDRREGLYRPARDRRSPRSTKRASPKSRSDHDDFAAGVKGRADPLLRQGCVRFELHQ